MRVALVHDWLTGMRGGEVVLEAMAEVFPDAELFTLISVPASVSAPLTALKKHTSWMQRFPGAVKRYRYFLPWMPGAIERFDLSGYDLILSSSHCVAKGVRKPPGSVHVSYVHAPMRYVWDRYDEYFGPGRAAPHVRLAARLVRRRLQQWDRSVSQADRVDLLLANSRYIADQIQAAYGREARVVHPFADLSRFGRARAPGRNYLMVGAFAPNKRVDLAIDCFNLLKLPLLIVGDGQEKERLKKRAGPTIEFLGGLSNAAIADLYSKCRAFVFPGKDDFGITPVEAMAAGAPVIAYAAGGALETVTEKTGVFFREQTVPALKQAVLEVERNAELSQGRFREEDCRARASLFTRTRFQKEWLSAVRDAWVASGRDERLISERIQPS